ncbi:MAG: dTMP kinase [Firmicutes bacterium]|nr:dTMP kinase [Bacillota bacterium]MBQ6809829.1 dTMP kinase [Bacillota bacterium]
MEKKGLFLVFEGIDGSGKTSQLKRTKEYLEAHGYDVLTTREPGGTPISEKIRGLLLDPLNGEMDDRCELLLYGAARAQHLAEVILPAIRNGKAVLCDRFSLSTAAYQGYGRGISLELLEAVHSVAAFDVKPDLTLVVDVPVEVSAYRVAVSRGEPKDRLEKEKSDFFERVRQGFLSEAEKDDSIVVINGVQTEEQVFEDIKKALEKVL